MTQPTSASHFGTLQAGAGSPCVGTLAVGEKYLSLRNETIGNKKNYTQLHGYRLIDLYSGSTGTQWRGRYSDVIEQKWEHIIEALSVGPPQGGGPCSILLWEVF